MLVAFYFFLTLAHMIAMIYLFPSKRDLSYCETFSRNMPIFYNIGRWLMVIIYFYFIIDFFTKGWIGVNYIDSFDTPKCYSIMAFFSLVIFIWFFNKIKDEIDNGSQEIIKKRMWAVPFIYFLLFSSSSLLSVVVFHFTNHFLDFSSREEHQVTVTSSYSKITGKGRNATKHYEISFTPSIYKVNKIEVSSLNQGLVNTGNKIKLYVYQGLYGVRYISNSIDLK